MSEKILRDLSPVERQQEEAEPGPDVRTKKTKTFQLHQNWAGPDSKVICVMSKEENTSQ